MTIRNARCACGQLTLTTSAEPIRISACHCLDCQLRSGSVFAVQARFPASSVTVAGASKTFVRIGENKTTFHFCPTCGGTVYYITEGAEDRVAIPVGAFADSAFPAPTISVFEKRKHAWVEMPAAMDHMA